MADPPRKPVNIPARVAQALLAEIANDLQTIEERLHAVHDSLPRSPHEEAMFEGHRPIDFPTILVGLVECALVDQIRPAIKALQQAAQLADQS